MVCLCVYILQFTVCEGYRWLFFVPAGGGTHWQAYAANFESEPYFASRKIYEPSRKSLSEWLPGLITSRI